MHFTFGCSRSLSYLGLIIVLSSHATACEDEHPPEVTEPVIERSLADKSGTPVLKMAFDPRGLHDLRTDEEPDFSWVRSDNNSAWDYREWQWWKGHPWGDSCRPRYWTTADFSAEGEQIRIRYKIDGFDNEQRFLLPATVDAARPHWDVLVSIRNVSGSDVEEYGQFFACYTALNEPNSFWFWEAGNRLTKFSDHGVSHLDGYVVHPKAYFAADGAVPHCPRGDGKIVSTWYRPVMVSHASPAGWRSVIMVEAEYAASLAQGIRGAAMDYIVFPGPDKKTFPDQDAFAVHVRHQLIKSPQLPTTDTLQQLWNAFEASHAEVHRMLD